ncbi:hypothetical protein VOLCADRAFT_105448 [Volvox carteri f. nagariensis]|uniref:BRX domain-containing protein n=1 Tax=Volvox carteri f. nagariensis TaxID=3068 RepID=D8U0V0_VOLCA|nr:uncharacterized protein VOLCADRAFT_105448 [Volvox carteri f. nagariensis]EFJ46779.1 hypothetical protein VOLCADRAFT_105448 [Volvox carteri f. nagariensis]|eukprot:XP_002952308.1 hypothetical protein VOLCADRAFT_105448 [Volvox carteri f. nagariensis]
MHHEMVVEEQPPGGSSASGGGGGGSGNGSGSGVPGGGMPGHGNTVAGGAGGTEQHASSSSGYNVPLALAADTLPPEGVQFQYAPGVYITLKPPAQKGGPVRLVKVRFNRKMFTEQSQGQAWWNMHRATLAEMYELTFDMGNKAPVAPSSSPPGLPPLAPGSHGTVPPAAMHTRGMSTDTQGTSAGSTAASGSSSMYFSVPVSNSPLHGGAASGAAGGGDLATGSAGAMWRSVASAVAGGGGGGGGAGGGGDFDMSWTELNYDSQAMMVLPPPPPVGTMGVAGSPAMPQRRDHSRNSSRTASGGSSHAGVSRPPSQPCPESPVFALQQFGSGGSGSAGGVGVGVGGDGGGGGGGPLYPATASALATAAAAAAVQPYYPSHQRAQSGGGSSGRSGPPQRLFYKRTAFHGRCLYAPKSTPSIRRAAAGSCYVGKYPAPGYLATREDTRVNQANSRQRAPTKPLATTCQPRATPGKTDSHLKLRQLREAEIKPPFLLTYGPREPN